MYLKDNGGRKSRAHGVLTRAHTGKSFFLLAPVTRQSLPNSGKYSVIAGALYGGEDETSIKLQMAMLHEIVVFCDEQPHKSGLVKRLFHEVYE